MYFFRLSSGVSNGYSSGAHGMTASMRSSSAPSIDKQGHTVSLLVLCSECVTGTVCDKMLHTTCKPLFPVERVTLCMVCVVFSFSRETSPAKWHSYGVKPECYMLYVCTLPFSTLQDLPLPTRWTLWRYWKQLVGAIWARRLVMMQTARTA